MTRCLLARSISLEILRLIGVDWGGTKIEAIAIADMGKRSHGCAKRHRALTMRAASAPSPQW